MTPVPSLHTVSREVEGVKCRTKVVGGLTISDLSEGTVEG